MTKNISDQVQWEGLPFWKWAMWYIPFQKVDIGNNYTPPSNACLDPRMEQMVGTVCSCMPPVTLVHFLVHHFHGYICCVAEQCTLEHEEPSSKNTHLHTTRIWSLLSQYMHDTQVHVSRYIWIFYYTEYEKRELVSLAMWFGSSEYSFSIFQPWETWLTQGIYFYDESSYFILCLGDFHF